EQGDLVVAHTDVTQDADIVGNPALVVKPDKYETLVITMDLMKVEGAEDWLSKEFLFYLFKSRAFKGHCLSCTNGTTVLHMSRKAVPSYKFKMPNREKIVTFTAVTKPTVEKTFANISQIRTLEELRDMLLPKLMSGKIRVEQ
ncbi:MAG: restriction endonuclease subunit S, partial [Salinispira sp.]